MLEFFIKLPAKNGGINFLIDFFGTTFFVVLIWKKSAADLDDDLGDWALSKTGLFDTCSCFSQLTS